MHVCFRAIRGLLRAFILFSCLKISAQETIPHRRVIDSAAISNWVSLGARRQISPDGRYFMFNVGNNTSTQTDLFLYAIGRGRNIALQSVSDGKFSNDSKHFIFFRNDSLCFLKLQTGEIKGISNVIPFDLSAYDFGEWIAYRKKDNHLGLTVINVISSKQYAFDSVENYLLDAKREVLIINKLSVHRNDTISQLHYFDLELGKGYSILSSTHSTEYFSEILHYVIDSSGEQIAVLSKMKYKRGDFMSIWYYKVGMDCATMKVREGTEDIEGYNISESDLRFSYDGNYIHFTLVLPPLAKKDNGFNLDVYSYKDTVLQSAQLFKDDMTNFAAVVNLRNHRIVRLEMQSETVILFPNYGDHVVVRKDRTGDMFWLAKQDPSYNHFFIMSMQDGTRNTLDVKGYCEFYFSPSGSHLVFYQSNTSHNYFSYHFGTGEIRNISNGIEHGYLCYNDRNQLGRRMDVPTIPAGIAKWLENEDALLVYDDYDVWKLDLLGIKKPLNITNGYGRSRQIRFRLVEEITDIHTSSARDKLLLCAFDEINKYNGFYSMQMGSKKNPEVLIMSPRTYFNEEGASSSFDFGMRPIKSANGTWIVKVQSAKHSPNYYTTKNFKRFTPITNLHPEDDYNWLTTELHSWYQGDSVLIQGVLYKPTDFSSTQKYPVLINYYDQLSNRIYQYSKPAYTNTSFNIPWFVSRGYLVFTPDVKYVVGNPGLSAFQSIISAYHYLSNLAFIDSSKIAINGHSTAGFLTNYIVTHTTKFAAAITGAGTSNAISSALQLSGRNGQRQDSRLALYENIFGGTIWGITDAFLDNSPVLRADQVATPLLLFHSKDDTAVPWDQAVEFYISLRRLSKPVWMLQYDGQNHNNSGRAAKDYTTRITQFFNHYLKGEPPPVWMSQGIPASKKGIELGYDLDLEGMCGKNCKVCLALSAKQ